ncbi:unnamed protein product, partial [Rangifer tarandus platyrhynchus]
EAARNGDWTWLYKPERGRQGCEKRSGETGADVAGDPLRTCSERSGSRNPFSGREDAAGSGPHLAASAAGAARTATAPPPRLRALLKPGDSLGKEVEASRLRGALWGLRLDRLPAVSAATTRLYAAPGAAGAESPPFLGHRSWSGPFPPADRAVGDAEKRAAAPAASSPLR